MLSVVIHTPTNNVEIDLTNIPILDIGTKQGHTDYIDFLTWNEVTSPIMKGIDMFKRPFIVIKLIIDGRKLMETYFQRFTTISRWHCCGHATKILISTTGGMSEIQANYVKSLVENGEVKLENEHRICLPFDNYNGKIVKIFIE